MAAGPYFSGERHPDGTLIASNGPIDDSEYADPQFPAGTYGYELRKAKAEFDAEWERLRMLLRHEVEQLPRPLRPIFRWLWFWAFD